MNLVDCCSVTLDLKEAEDEVTMTFVAETNMSSKLVPWWSCKLQVAISPVPMHVKEFA